MRKSKGFTLIELLIAIAILSIIAVLMVRGLQIVMVSKERIDESNTNLEEMQLAMALINQDLQEFVHRSIINNDGQLEPAFFIDGGALSLTRGGYVNPDGIEKRSTLQRISYKMGNGLQRVTWPVLDRVSSTPTYSRTILKTASSVQWQFLANDGKLYTEWPQQGQTIPNAIQMTLSLRNGQQLNRLFIMNVTEDPPSDDKKNPNNPNNYSSNAH
jgi:general secretion pathway protein J